VDGGEPLAGWILATVAAAGIYGAVKNKNWLSVLTGVVNPSVPAKPIYTTVKDSTGTAPDSVGLSGASVTGVSSVIAYAQAQLGKPYKWGAAGPSAFDCSGLTMRAFDTVGINLPHNSAAQLVKTRIHEIAQTDDPPAGALVFYGTPPHHVGISIGNGNMISAPHTGDVVKVSSVAGFGSDFSAVTFPIVASTPASRDTNG
jgi:cell wall-associated NlpC family hydrolase